MLALAATLMLAAAPPPPDAPARAAARAVSAEHAPAPAAAAARGGAVAAADAAPDDTATPDAGLPAPTGSGITFTEDDWPGALARAKRERKPLFVDAWATWCHTCLSMRNFVFPDPGLRGLASRVVWAAIDTEKPGNRAFVEAFPMDAWPTFFVLDPASGRVIDRWIGAATVAELRRFVTGALDAFERSRAPGPAATAVAQALAAGKSGDFEAAAGAWERAVKLTVASDPARPSRLVSLAMALYRDQSPEAARRCAKLGLAELDATGNSASATDFTSLVTECAQRLPESDPMRRELLERAVSRLDGLVHDAAAPLSVDDRSDAYANLVRLLDATGRHDLALERTRARLRLLEKAAAAAPDVRKAATFDAHRVDAYWYLHDLDAAATLLARREREIPDDYNPPARLARVLLEKGDRAEALAAVDRALALAPRGMRRVGLLRLKVQILTALGRPTVPVLEEQLALYRELPSTQRSAAGLAAIEKSLAAARRAEATREPHAE